MSFLVLDIANQPVPIFKVMSKSPIPFLPPVKIWKQLFLFDKSVACQFDVFYQRRQPHGWMNMNKQMKVVFHTINPVHMAYIVVQNPPRYS